MKIYAFFRNWPESIIGKGFYRKRYYLNVEYILQGKDNN